MQVVRVSAKNFKGTKLIEFCPKGTTTLIGGNNRQGKSSLLDSISAALGGKKLCPERPIRDGQAEAEVQVELNGDQSLLLHPCVVIRKFWLKESGEIDSKLEIITKDGYQAPSPQKLLDKVCGKLGFDPEAFLRMDSKKQLEVLKDLVGLDFEELDLQRKTLYDKRTVVGNEGKRIRSQFDALIFHPGVPEEEVSIIDLIGLVKKTQKVNAENLKERAKLQNLRSAAQVKECSIAEAEQVVADLEQKLAKAKKDVEKARDAHTESLKELTAQTHIVNALKDTDTSEFEKQMGEIEGTNKKVRDNLRRKELEQTLTLKQEEWKVLTSEINKIDATKKEMVEAAKWPVDGLGYDETGVTFDDRPLAQASSYEQRKAAMGICMALSPSLKTCFVKDGSLLDNNALLEFAQLAAENHVQLFIERVGKGEENNIIIENGEIERADEELLPKG